MLLIFDLDLESDKWQWKQQINIPIYEFNSQSEWINFKPHLEILRPSQMVVTVLITAKCLANWRRSRVLFSTSNQRCENFMASLSLSFYFSLSLMKHTHSLSSSVSHTLFLSKIHAHTHTLALSHTHTHTYTLSLYVSHTLSYSNTRTHTQSLSHTHFYSLHCPLRRD